MYNAIILEKIHVSGMEWKETIYFPLKIQRWTNIKKAITQQIWYTNTTENF
jgi:hypothetical protein